MKVRKVITIASLCLSLAILNLGLNTSDRSKSVKKLPGLRDHVQVIRDSKGIPHIYARNESDVYFALGHLHAEDRFFQMDVSRRTSRGTLAELLGPGQNDSTLSSDTSFRNIGHLRAAIRSVNAYSPEHLAIIQAYADGVNSWLRTNPLPPEYTLLEINKDGVPPWEVIDCLAISNLIAFNLSFETVDLSDTLALLQYIEVGNRRGFDGVKLFVEDAFRNNPFEPAVTAPRSLQAQEERGAIAEAKEDTDLHSGIRSLRQLIQPQTEAGIRQFLDSVVDLSLAPLRQGSVGSNWWVIGGSKTEAGRPLMANDPHLGLGSPSTFYEAHLNVDGRSGAEDINVSGVSFPGVPGVILGFNEKISWGTTTSLLDVTDFYQERVVVDGSGLPVATIYQGRAEPVTLLPEQFRINQIGDGVINNSVEAPPGRRPSGVFVPPANAIVPRRNNGPFVTFPEGTDPNNMTAISVQYTGFGPTRNLATFFLLAKARNLHDFKRALRFFDIGAQNFCYTDIHGNIAFIATGESPLREDLQAGQVDGAPPFFIRDGTGAHRNEWLRNDDPPHAQALPFEILPFEEMPQVVNPPQGFIVNANNDPLGLTLDNDPLNAIRPSGQGIYYLNPEYDGGYRAGRIARLIEQELDYSRGGDGAISFEDMMRMQSNVQMLDAEVLTPYIIRAFGAARADGVPAPIAALARDAAIIEAVGRLSAWNFSAPTGIQEGYDANDVNGMRHAPDAQEIADSVAATIYSVWRGQILRNTIGATLTNVGITIFPDSNRLLVGLRNLLDNFAVNGGRGASGLNFFDVPGVSLPPEAERDLIILGSLKGALNLLAGDAFAPAFNRSSNQEDYRWGKLHRIVFSHSFRQAAPSFSIPPAGGFSHLSENLTGVSTDGGFGVVDSSNHSAIANSLNAFMFSGGPARRFVAEMRPFRIKAVQSLPGGEDASLESPFFANLLEQWITNDYHPVLFTRRDVNRNKSSITNFVPTR